MDGFVVAPLVMGAAVRWPATIAGRGVDRGDRLASVSIAARSTPTRSTMPHLLEPLLGGDPRQHVVAWRRLVVDGDGNRRRSRLGWTTHRASAAARSSRCTRFVQRAGIPTGDAHDEAPVNRSDRSDGGDPVRRCRPSGRRWSGCDGRVPPHPRPRSRRLSGCECRSGGVVGTGTTDPPPLAAVVGTVDTGGRGQYRSPRRWSWVWSLPSTSTVPARWVGRRAAAGVRRGRRCDSPRRRRPSRVVTARARGRPPARWAW